MSLNVLYMTCSGSRTHISPYSCQLLFSVAFTSGNRLRVKTIQLPGHNIQASPALHKTGRFACSGEVRNFCNKSLVKSV